MPFRASVFFRQLRFFSMCLYLINVQNAVNYASGMLVKCYAIKAVAASQIRAPDGSSGRCD